MTVLPILASATEAAGTLARGSRRLGVILSLLPLALFLYLSSLAAVISSGETIRLAWSWVPSLELLLSFHLDGLSLLFALLITGIGALVMVYAGGYLEGVPRYGRFFAFLLLFMGSMLGLVLADNLIALYVFWELTSISSYLLIGFDHESAVARAAALQALVVTVLGGLAMLAGLVLMGHAGGSLELSVLSERGEVLRSHPHYGVMFVLILAGALTKSAQFPFHFWLPGAMAAPTPVSAYLHSATMVKAGVYLLARTTPLLGGTDLWMYTVTAFGGVTLLVGGYLALRQSDLKLVLAFSTVSALGVMVLLLGLGSTQAIQAALVFLLAHALYKGALFMVAGILDHQTGTRDLERLGGLRSRMPWTTAVAVLAALSLAGLGPVLSFIGKEMLFAAVWEAAGERPLLTPVALLGGALFVTVAAITGIRPFFGERRRTPIAPHEASWLLLLGPGLLAILGVLIGVAPGVVATSVVSPAVQAVLGAPAPVELALWHGLNPALGLSILAVLIGLTLYRAWEKVRLLPPGLERILAWGPARWYALALEGVNHLARLHTRLVQDGYLRHYVMIIIVTTLLLVGYPLVTRVVHPAGPVWDVRSYEVGIAAFIVVATLFSVRSRNRLGTVAGLGAVGYGVSLIFVHFGAPDLALTQFLIETLSVILFVLIFYHLPRFMRLSARPSRVLEVLIALGGGALMAVLVFVAAGYPYDAAVSRYYAEHSVPEAHGRNIVNVILVDFRALDTLGELTVLALAGVGVHALLKLRHTKEDKG